MRCRDRRRRSQAGFGAGCALLFLALILLTDWAAGTLTVPRALLWTALAAVFLAVLVPPGIRVAPGRLTVRCGLRVRAVRTDALVSVRQQDGVSAQLTLHDVDGRHVQVDPRALTASPFLWHALETGVHRSVRAGTLVEGEQIIERLSEEMDGEAVRGVERASELVGTAPRDGGRRAG
ncbi:hypothetical protein AB0465_12100 [Streptomyces griseoviridis]|uniref:hypothetical protein n=1 Tax=Streptomyces griseoviridis TaxID=45398 RepID=UPI0019D024E5|nr:hypothetical protein [Streptomyces griseoviridis]